MNRSELIVGETYILKSPSREAIFDGVHSGALALEGGGQFYGHNGFLRFHFERDQQRHEVFLPTGAEVVETVKTKALREQREFDRKRQIAYAREEAINYLRDLGLIVTQERTRGEFGIIRIDEWSAEEESDQIKLDGFRVGDLKRAMKLA